MRPLMIWAQRIFSSRVARAFLLGLPFLFLAYTAIRAGVLSMTHDESSTYLNYQTSNIFESFFSKKYWQTANLHILNSLLMQASEYLFGTSEFALRLPNVLAHVLYLLYSLKLVKLLSNEPWLQLAGFLFLNANPFLLDFFSLARGYGLACGFMVMSFYYLFKSIESFRPGHILLCYLAAFFSVLSNFTFLQYFLVLFISICFILIVSKLNRSKRLNLNFTKKYHPFFIGILFVLALFYLLRTPIAGLQESGEFLWGAPNLRLSFFQLTEESIYYQRYFSKLTTGIFLNIGFILAGFLILSGLLVAEKAEVDSNGRAFFLISLLCFLLILGLIAQHLVFGSNYPDGQKSVIFIPPGAILFFLGMQYYYKKHPSLIIVLAIFFSFFMLNHFFRAHNFYYVNKWKYDAYTKEMIYSADSISSGKGELQLGTHWLYSHASNFYIHTGKGSDLNPVPYEKELRKDLFYDLYYIPLRDSIVIDSNYLLIRQFGKEGGLYQRPGKGKE